jgi:hypothetical protein
MNKLGKSLISNNKFELKEGQRKLLPSSKDLIRCPSLSYEHTPSSEDKVDKAFDLLFEEIIRLGKN